jgi:hypothetical protein
MADDINKTISIDIGINPDGLQQITQYKAAFDDLKTSINMLGQPLTNVSNTISSLSKDLSKLSVVTATSAADAAKSIAGAVATADQIASTAVKQGNEKREALTTASVKSTLKTILNWFVKNEDDKTKAATDAATKTGQATAATTKLFQTQAAKDAITTTQQISDATYKVFTDKLQMQSQAKLKALQDDEAKALSVANLSANQKLAIQASYKKKENDVQKKAFKEKQDADIAQAVINGAVAITKVSAQSGIAAPFMIGAVIAETAAQVAKIAAQKPPAMAKGGYFQSDGKGAVLPGYSRTDNTNAYLRSGEAVVVSEAMRDPWARNLVSAINVAFGGRDFSVPSASRGYAVGGIFTDGGNANRYYNQPMNDQKNLANTVAYQMINNFPPVYVDVKDINNQQNILAQTVNRVNL